VAIVGGIFFACLLTLTYMTRVINAELAWLIISLVLLILIYPLGINRRLSLAAIICTLVGVVLPVFGFLIPFTGLTLSLAGLLSVVWLAVLHWYGCYNFANEK
jgi:hypothetical protein